MLLSNYLKSTPIRLALILNATLLSTSFIAASVFYLFISYVLVEQIDMRVNDHFRVFKNYYDAHGKESLMRQIKQHIEASRERSYLYNLSSSGTFLIYNFTPESLKTERGFVRAPDEDGDLENYRYISRPVGDFQLTIAINAEDIDDVINIIVMLLQILLPSAVLISLFVGTVLTRRTQKRLEDLTLHLSKVANGDLQVRLPLTQSNDDINQLSKIVNLTLDQLQASVLGMQQVSTDIAHDLKTPIYRLYIALNQSIKKSLSGKDITDELHAALHEAESLNVIFEGLLRISQIETKKRKSYFSEINLNEIVSVLIDAYAPVADDQGAKINFHADENSLPVNGDKSLITQMIANLLDNALRHGPEDVKIKISVSSTKSTSTVHISDTGLGIPPEEYEQVFRRFYRLEKSRTTPGNGLGLSMVNAIAELHGAEIKLGDNHPGLCVSITFPTLESLN